MNAASGLTTTHYVTIGCAVFALMGGMVVWWLQRWIASIEKLHESVGKLGALPVEDLKTLPVKLEAVAGRLTGVENLLRDTREKLPATYVTHERLDREVEGFNVQVERLRSEADERENRLSGQIGQSEQRLSSQIRGNNGQPPYTGRRR